MSPQSFDNLKVLKFIITLYNGTFESNSDEPVYNQLTLEGFRASVLVNNGGGNMNAQLTAQIYGLTLSDINAITTIAQAQTKAELEIGVKNVIQVFAIDGDQSTLVFQGPIMNAWGNFTNQPDCFLEIYAQAGYIQKLQPVAATSFQGTVDVATIMTQLAGVMGYGIELNGVSVILSNPSFCGSAWQQADSAAKAAGIAWGVENDTTLWITPNFNTQRVSTGTPEVSEESGMAGYPTIDAYGVTFKTLFRPDIRFMKPVSIVSSIPRAQGTWLVSGINHHLESNKPGGAWFSECRANWIPQTTTGD